MNSIGVNGEVRVRAAAAASTPGERFCDGRSPTARFPTWSWSLEYARKAWPPTAERSTGTPQSASRKVDRPPSCRNTDVSTLASVVYSPKST